MSEAIKAEIYRPDDMETPYLRIVGTFTDLEADPVSFDVTPWDRVRLETDDLAYVLLGRDNLDLLLSLDAIAGELQGTPLTHEQVREAFEQQGFESGDFEIEEAEEEAPELPPMKTKPSRSDMIDYFLRVLGAEIENVREDRQPHQSERYQEMHEAFSTARNLFLAQFSN